MLPRRRSPCEIRKEHADLARSWSTRTAGKLRLKTPQTSSNRNHRPKKGSWYILFFHGEVQKPKDLEIALRALFKASPVCFWSFTAYANNAPTSSSQRGLLHTSPANRFINPMWAPDSLWICLFSPTKGQIHKKMEFINQFTDDM